MATFLRLQGLLVPVGMASKPCRETLAIQGLSPLPRLSLASNRASGGCGPRTPKDFFDSLQCSFRCSCFSFRNTTQDSQQQIGQKL